MNFSPLPVIMLMVGIVLIYSGVKDVDPRTVVKNALQGKPTKSASAKTVTPPPSGFDPGAGAGKGSGDSGGGSW